MSTVLGSQVRPGGGAAGASALPSTGQGSARDSAAWLITWLALAAGAAGMATVVIMKQRRG